MSADDGGVGVGVGVDLLSPFSSSLSWAAAAQQPRRANSAAALAGVSGVNVNVNAASAALATHWANSALSNGGSAAVALLSASAANVDDTYASSSLHPSSNDFHLYAFDHHGNVNLSSAEQDNDPLKAANNFIGAAMHNNFEGDFDATFLTHSLHNPQQAFADALVNSHDVNGGVADDLALANSYANSNQAVNSALSAHSLIFPSTQLQRSVSNPNAAVAALNAANSQQRVDEDGSHSHGQLVENSLDVSSAFHSSMNRSLAALNGAVDGDESLLHLHQEIERSSSYPGSSSQPSTAAAASIWQNFSSNSATNPSIAGLEAYFSTMALGDKKALGVNGLNSAAFAENLASANVNANHLHANLSLSAPQSTSSIAAQLMLQQQQQSQQRAQLHSVLNGQVQNANSTASQSPPPSNPTANNSAAAGGVPQSNGASSPSNGGPNAIVNLATVAGGLNPASLLSSAESSHALPLLEPLLAVSPLVNLLSVDDMKKSVQLRCVLLELDRAYKEIVHLKQENMHLQKNIDKCIKMMNLQDVDQYVNQLARMRYPGPPPMGNISERNSKANYHKNGGGGGYNNNGGGHHAAAHANANYASENSGAAGSESENDGSGGGHSQHNQYGRRVYYGPNSGGGGGGNRGRGNYRGGGNGNRGGRYHSNRGE